MCARAGKAELMEAFRAFDKDGDECISQHEIKLMAGNVTEKREVAAKKVAAKMVIAKMVIAKMVTEKKVAAKMATAKMVATKRVA